MPKRSSVGPVATLVLPKRSPGFGGVTRRMPALQNQAARARWRRRRDRYLRAARRLIERDGFDGLSVLSVARELGLTKASVYYYFESKDELVAALADEILLEEVSALGVLIDSAPDASTALSSMVRGFVEHYVARPTDFRIAYSLTDALGLQTTLLECDSYPKLVALAERLTRALGKDATESRRELSPARRVDLARALAQGIVQRALNKPKPKAFASELLQEAALAKLT
jgi:AcrR family transcriptional regulator